MKSLLFIVSHIGFHHLNYTYIMFQLLEAICAVMKSRCARPMCGKPFTPTGHCCPICGILL